MLSDAAIPPCGGQRNENVHLRAGRACGLAP